MRKDGRVAGRHNAKEQVAQTRRRIVVWRLDENVARVVEREEVAAVEACGEIRNYVIVRARDEAQGNVLRVERKLQLGDFIANLLSRIVIEAWQNVGRAGECRDAVGDPGARHGE